MGAQDRALKLYCEQMDNIQSVSMVFYLGDIIRKTMELFS